MHKPAWTACIPVRNEEATIGRTIHSLQRQTIASDLTAIIIHANACTDGTVHVVRREAEKDNRIGLVISSIPGKARAWNELREVAKTEYVLFTDGDIVLHERAAEEIQGELRKNSLQAVIGGTAFPFVADLPPFQRFLGAAYIPRKIQVKPWITGQLYMVHQERLTAQLKRNGYVTMPEQVLHEDAWLKNAVTPYWSVTKKAIVFVRPHALTEELSMAIRYRAAFLQREHDEMPSLASVNHQRTTEQSFLQKVQRVVQESPHLSSTLAFSMRHILARICAPYILRQAQKKIAEQDRAYWYRSNYSKQPLPEGLETLDLSPLY